MERTRLDFDRYFEVVMGTDEAQAAEMTVKPGRTVGGPDNYHPDSDQWLFVASGSGVATVDGGVVVVGAADCPAGLDGHLGGLCLVGPHDHLEVAVEIETGSLHTDG